MPRHIHKPAKDKSTKSLLQNMQEAQKATREIKAELLEHNSAIHLHSAHDASQGQRDNEARTPTKKDTSDNAKAFSGSNLAQAVQQTHDMKSSASSESKLSTMPKFPPSAQANFNKTQDNAKGSSFKSTVGGAGMFANGGSKAGEAQGDTDYGEQTRQKASSEQKSYDNQQKAGKSREENSGSHSGSKTADTQKNFNSQSDRSSDTAFTGAFFPFQQAVDMMRQNASQWLELQSQFSFLWLNGWNNLLPKDKKE